MHRLRSPRAGSGCARSLGGCAGGIPADRVDRYRAGRCRRRVLPHPARGALAHLHPAGRRRPPPGGGRRRRTAQGFRAASGGHGGRASAGHRRRPGRVRAGRDRPPRRRGRRTCSTGPSPRPAGWSGCARDCRARRTPSAGACCRCSRASTSTTTPGKRSRTRCSTADVGVGATSEIVERLKDRTRVLGTRSQGELRALLAEELVARPAARTRPHPARAARRRRSGCADGRRRQRHRQDHHLRQAGPRAGRRRVDRAARRGRHLPGRRRRPAGDVGRAGRRRDRARPGGR